MASPELEWLPEAQDWRERIAGLARGAGGFEDAVRLARTRLDFVRANALDQIVARRWPEPPAGFEGRPYKLALLSSSTTAHLAPALRVAGLRHGLWLKIHEGDFGLYRQALEDAASGLHAFRPDAALFAFDAERLCAGVRAGMTAEAAEAAFTEACADLVALWRRARDAGFAVLQQTALPAPPPLMGANEHRLPGSRAAFLARLNHELRALADAEGVDLVALDAAAARDGLALWRDPTSWARAKQDVKPAAAPMYGELVARVLAAKLGRSRKCLVLDLDNTLWGGVIGDDGLEGVALGQGSALGEGFLSVQAYARELMLRGVILAVCSKNDEANALAPFERHPDMILRRDDIACFVANWRDKAENVAEIARRLNIGLDSLVLLDDSPFERNRVREALPTVAVPEVPEDPARVPDALAAAGYFESVGVTSEDRGRAGQYRSNLAREAERARHADLDGYLAGLQMRAPWGYFDAQNRPRIVQLINKTNQFNLTTRRCDEAGYDALLRDERVTGLHLRLIDRFGDNGLIAVVIARLGGGDLAIGTWLMSCRVLGRGVEKATLALIVAEARRRGARRLVGEYIPSSKNAMVREHYESLGFRLLEENSSGAKRLALALDGYAPGACAVALEPALAQTSSGMV